MNNTIYKFDTEVRREKISFASDVIINGDTLDSVINITIYDIENNNNVTSSMFVTGSDSISGQSVLFTLKGGDAGKLYKIIVLASGSLDNDIVYQQEKIVVINSLESSLVPGEMQIFSSEIPSGVVNGINSIFVLSEIPETNSENVFLNGVLLYAGLTEDYLISGDIITFNTPPAVGDIIIVYFTPRSTTHEIPTGDIDGINTIFTLFNIPDANTENVFLNGLLQEEGLTKDYTIVDNIITFNIPPEVGDKIVVNYTNEGIVGEVPSGNINGINTDFTLLNTPVNGYIEVFLNGLVQVEGITNDYTISNNVIVFNNPPEIGDYIVVNYLN